MEYSIDYLPEKKTVMVRFSGVINDTGPVQKAAREMTTLASEHKCTKFLADYTDATLEVDTIDLYESANLLLDLGFKQTDKVASIISGDRESIEFFQTVAQNRGWFNVRIFADRESAFQWLEEE